MPNREETLREKTHKEDGLELEKRIFYTLTDGDSSGESSGDPSRVLTHVPSVPLYRTAKFTALLTKRLRDANLITDDEIDDLLLETIR